MWPESIAKLEHVKERDVEQSPLRGDTVVMLLPPRTDSPWFHDFSWRRREWILHPWSPALRRPQELSAVPVDDRSVSPAELEFVSVIAHGDCSMLDTSEMLDEDMTAEELRPERLASSV